MTLGEALSARLVELCEERGLTINKLCNISGVTQSTVNNLLNGRNNSTTVSTIKKLCDGADITLAEFFDSDLFKTLDPEIR